MFAPLVELYKRVATRSGHDVSKLTVASHSHGFVGEQHDEAVEKFFPSTQYALNKIGRERGWAYYDRNAYDSARSMQGALYVGDAEYVAQKIIYLRKTVGITRFLLHCPVGSMPHEDVMKSIELLGTKVAPIVREEVAKWEAENQDKDHA